MAFEDKAHANKHIVTVYKNGDIFYVGKSVVIRLHTEAEKSLDVVMEKITLAIKNKEAVRRLYTTKGVRLLTIEAFANESCVVAGGKEGFKSIDYTKAVDIRQINLKNNALAKANQPVWVPKIDNEAVITPDKIAASNEKFHSEHMLEKIKKIEVVCNADPWAGVWNFHIFPKNGSYEQFLQLVSDKVRLHSGSVDKLCTCDGVDIKGYSELVNNTRYVAVDRHHFKHMDYINPGPKHAIHSPPKQSSSLSFVSKNEKSEKSVLDLKTAAPPTTKWAKMEFEIKNIASVPAKCHEYWVQCDTTNAGSVSLGDFKKWVTRVFPLLNNRQSNSRACSAVLSEDISDSDTNVSQSEFKQLLVNILYFDRFFFDDGRH